MNIKTAYHYTKKFNTKRFNGYSGLPSKPVILEDIFIATDNSKITVLLREHNFITKAISLKVFDRKYKKYFGRDIYLYRDNSSYLPTEPLYITSKGLIPEDDYLLAEDIMEQMVPIKRKELILGMKYKSIVDKEYLYIGDINGVASIYFDNKIENNFIAKDILLDLKTNRLVYFSNILLLEEINLNTKKIELNDAEVFLKMESYFSTVKGQKGILGYGVTVDSFECDYDKL